jgi:hypothetical protein
VRQHSLGNLPRRGKGFSSPSRFQAAGKRQKKEDNDRKTEPAYEHIPSVICRDKEGTVQGSSPASRFSAAGNKTRNRKTKSRTSVRTHSLGKLPRRGDGFSSPSRFLAAGKRQNTEDKDRQHGTSVRTHSLGNLQRQGRDSPGFNSRFPLFGGRGKRQKQTEKERQTAGPSCEHIPSVICRDEGRGSVPPPAFWRREKDRQRKTKTEKTEQAFESIPSVICRDKEGTVQGSTPASRFLAAGKKTETNRQRQTTSGTSVRQHSFGNLPRRGKGFSSPSRFLAAWKRQKKEDQDRKHGTCVRKQSLGNLPRQGRDSPGFKSRFPLCGGREKTDTQRTIKTKRGASVRKHSLGNLPRRGKGFNSPSRFLAAGERQKKEDKDRTHGTSVRKHSLGNLPRQGRDSPGFNSRFPLFGGREQRQKQNEK